VVSAVAIAVQQHQRWESARLRLWYSGYDAGDMGQATVVAAAVERLSVPL
jgi:hypothetical protein